MNALSEFIAGEIRRAGPVPFARFMDWALYCPELGYYEQISHTPGRAGDYFTSVSVGPLFGALLASQFSAWTHALPGTVHWIETGAQDGRLAADLLDWVQRHRPALWERLEYWITEPSPRHRVWQQETLRRFAGRVRWLDLQAGRPEPAIRGVWFANEFLDALPVRRLGWDAPADRWFEWGVDSRAGAFHWVRLPGPVGGAPDPPPGVAALLPDAFTVDWCSAAEQWWSAASARLAGGYLVTIDYGLEWAALFEPVRRAGTLRSYRRHRVGASPIEVPGTQDLTAHVCWTRLRDAGEAGGLVTRDLLAQERFLSRIVATGFSPDGEGGGWTEAATRQLQTLIHPNHLGARFQVLVQSRPVLGT